VFQTTLAGAQKHAAIPKPPVRVGVAKRRKKLVGEFTQRDHPAPREVLHVPRKAKGEAGYTLGT
jgi:hypothetical protein